MQCLSFVCSFAVCVCFDNNKAFSPILLAQLIRGLMWSLKKCSGCIWTGYWYWNMKQVWFRKSYGTIAWSLGHWKSLSQGHLADHTQWFEDMRTMTCMLRWLAESTTNNSRDSEDRGFISESQADYFTTFLECLGTAY